jgi:L-cysteate sulfo-lyase
MTDRIPRHALAALPTPLHPLPRLSEQLGIELWIKRDDLTGFAMGGNKVRKAEYLIADAIRRGCTEVITAGAVQSNHARVIAAAAAAVGLECHLVLSGSLSVEPRGNVLLDRLSGANLHVVSSSAERAAAMDALASAYAAAGHAPYVIPIGGSNAVGAQGYVTGFEELSAQLAALPPRPTRLVFASSSGGTFAGLLAGRALARSDVRLLGIRVDLDADPEVTIAQVASEAAKLRGSNLDVHPSGVDLCSDYVGEGYGIPTEAGMDAIRTLWTKEGILLDPVYTGKAMAGLIDMAMRGAFHEERIVFLHTGGEPSVFARTDII